MLRSNYQSVCVSLACLLIGFVAEAGADSGDLAKQLLNQSGVSGGLVVHLGAGDGELTAALRQNDTTQVHGLVRDAD